MITKEKRPGTIHVRATCFWQNEQVVTNNYVDTKEEVDKLRKTCQQNKEDGIFDFYKFEVLS